MADRKPQNRPPVARDAKGRIAPGVSGNPGGRPKSLIEIQRMLDADHRTVTNMRDVYARLRVLAMGEPTVITDAKGAPIAVELRPHPGFMELYLNRVEGPVREIKADLTDAPPEVVEWLAEHLN